MHYGDLNAGDVLEATTAGTDRPLVASRCSVRDRRGGLRRGYVLERLITEATTIGARVSNCR